MEDSNFSPEQLGQPTPEPPHVRNNIPAAVVSATPAATPQVTPQVTPQANPTAGAADPSAPDGQPSQLLQDFQAIQQKPNALVNGSPFATLNPATRPSNVNEWDSDSPAPDMPEHRSVSDSLWKLNDTIEATISNDWVVPSVYHAAMSLGFTPDRNYQAPAYDSPEYKALTDGIPVEFQDRLSAAVSADHAQYIAGRIKDELAAQDKLAQYGAWGIPLSLGVNLLDPTALAVMTASGGIGVATKASRLTKVLTAAGSGAAMNAGLAALSDAGSQTRDLRDVGYAALLGAGLGTAGGLWSTQIEKNIARRLTATVTNRLEAQEAIQTLNERGIASPADLQAKARAPVDLSQADSGGAMRVNDGEVRPLVDSESIIPHDDVAQTAFGKFRFDIAARLRGNENADVRGLLGKLVGDSVGTGSDAVSVVGASDVAQRLESSYLARFYTAIDEHLPQYAKENNISATNYGDRTAFMERVSNYIRGGEEADSHVTGFGNKVRGLLNEVREDAKGAGVKGFDTIPQDDNYLPRQINGDSVTRFNKDYGTGKVDLMLAQAIKATAGSHLDDEAIAKIAEGYHQRLREVDRGMDAAHQHGLKMDDADLMSKLVSEGGGDMELANRVKQSVQEMLAKRDAGGEGSVRYSKHRMDLDENHEVKLFNNTTGQVDTVKVSDLFDSNTEELFNRYAGSMSGHIGLAKEAGIKSLADFEQRINQVRGLIDKPSERESVVNAAKVAHAMITKVPVVEHDADSLAASAARFGRILRQFNFARQMGSMVFAHLGELGKIVAYGNLRAVMQHVPVLRSILGSGMDKELAHEIVETMGLGTEHLVDRRFIGSDPLASNLFNSANRAMAKLTHAVTVGQGFSHTISAMQTLAGKVSAQRMLNTALSQGSEYSAKQLAFMGVDREMASRIAGQLKGNATVSEGFGTQLRAINLANWKDLDARDAFIAAVRRDATRMVQTNGVDSAMAQKSAHGTLGKVVLQFRQYLMHSYAKSTLQGIAQGDAEAYARFATSCVWASMIYVAEQTLKREAYKAASAVVGNHVDTSKYDENLTQSEIAKAGFARSGLFSLLPTVIDTGSQLVRGKAFFDKRVSGLQSGAFSLDTNPTMQALKGISDHIGHLHNGEPTSGDIRFWMSMLPFRNVTGIGQVLDAIADKVAPKDHK